MRELQGITFVKSDYPVLRRSLSEDFVQSLNADLVQLKALIIQFNETQEEPEKTEILFEIEVFRNSIINTYPGDCIANCQQFHQQLYDQLFQDIQEEFTKRGISVYKPKLNQYDVATVRNDTHQNQLDNLLSSDDSSLFTEYFGDHASASALEIQYLMKNIAKEPDFQHIHKDLKQLKEMLRLYIAKERPTKEQTQSLRSLVGALNTKLHELEVKHLDVKAASSTPVGFAEFIATMSSDKLAEFTAILMHENSRTPAVLKANLDKLYFPPSDPLTNEELQFLEIRKYSITPMPGKNSRNFRISNADGSWVLKVDNRLYNPKTVESQLAENALSTTITAKFVDRTTSFVNKANGEKVTRGLLITEECTGGSIESYSTKFINARDKLSSAFKVYRQMAVILCEVQKSNAAFPDLKNSNWLVDEKGVIMIADTKSFVPAKDGFIDKKDPGFKWFRTIETPSLAPPEQNLSGPIEIEPLHAYILGRNMYHYMTGNIIKDSPKKHDASQYNFPEPPFQGVYGQGMKQLIMALVKPNPKDRMKVGKALEILQTLEMEQLRDGAVRLIELYYRGDEKSQQLSKVYNNNDIKFISQFVTELHEIIEAKKDHIKLECETHLAAVTKLGDVKAGFYTTELAAATTVEQLLELRNMLVTQRLTVEEKAINKRIGQLPYRVNHEQYNKLIESAQSVVNTKGDFEGFDKINKRFDQMMQHSSQKQKLMLQVNNLIHQGFSDKDQHMEAYMTKLRDRIALASKEQLQIIEQQLKNIVESPLLTEIHVLIDQYKSEGKSPFSRGMREKARSIEEAFAKVPVYLRDKIFLEPAELAKLKRPPSTDELAAMLEVRKAVASHRYGGDRGLMRDNDINPEKAVQRYTAYKDKYNKLKENNIPHIEDEEVHNNSLGK
ncbi:MAG: hypothetical protein WC627_07340 [Legionella sp.]|jgi:hypothetical protein